MPENRSTHSASEAIEALRHGLQGGRGGVSTEPGGVTFPALRVSGPAGKLFVSAYEGEDGVVFLAPPVDEVPYRSACEVIGTASQVPYVAGIVRGRVSR